MEVEEIIENHWKRLGNTWAFRVIEYKLLVLPYTDDVYASCLQNPEAMDSFERVVERLKELPKHKDDESYARSSMDVIDTCAAVVRACIHSHRMSRNGR